MKLTYTIVACCCIASAAFVFASNATQQKAKQGTASSTSSAKQQEEKTELSKFMRQKLSTSNGILEGLVTDDLKKVDEGAEKLLEMSDAERWRASNDMMYMHHSREFRRRVETMQDKAKKKSTDGVALAWIDVTMSCIRCHEWVRDTMLADGALAPGVEMPIDGHDLSGLTGGAK